ANARLATATPMLLTRAGFPVACPLHSVPNEGAVLLSSSLRLPESAAGWVSGAYNNSSRSSRTGCRVPFTGCDGTMGSLIFGRGPAVTCETWGGALVRATAPVSGVNEPGAASSRGYLKVGPGGP